MHMIYIIAFSSRWMGSLSLSHNQLCKLQAADTVRFAAIISKPAHLFVLCQIWEAVAFYMCVKVSICNIAIALLAYFCKLQVPNAALQSLSRGLPEQKNAKSQILVSAGNRTTVRPVRNPSVYMAIYCRGRTNNTNIHIIICWTRLPFR